jgi:hypothetical protein
VAKKCLQTAELTGVNFVSTGLRAKNVFWVDAKTLLWKPHLCSKQINNMLTILLTLLLAILLNMATVTLLKDWYFMLKANIPFDVIFGNFLLPNAHNFVTQYHSFYRLRLSQEYYGRF